ncbi:MAG: MerR family transcriptional regulator [Caldilineaceae bacterium]
MGYTVKQLADIAGVSVRTLHYYDEIGLLTPSAVRENGYRTYGHQELLRLQQILFFRELDFSLTAIRDLLDRPGFDMPAALSLQRQALQLRITRLTELVNTINSTISHLQGETTMSANELFAGFDAAKQAAYEEEIRARYGNSPLQDSQSSFAAASPAEKQRMIAEGNAIYNDLAHLIDHDPASPEVMVVMARWHQQLRYFYEPTPEVLHGLGELYATHPDFIATFTRLHPALPDFLRQATAAYATQVADHN